MEQIVVKSEMPNSGEILLFYVDENGGNEEGVLTTVESIENQAVQMQQDNSYVIEDVGDLSNDYSLLQETNQKDNWSEDDIKRLLVFYNDNKQTFVSGATKKEHLWTVACKTMLVGKNPKTCEVQLHSLKSKYIQLCDELQQGVYPKWPHFEICHQIFQDDYYKDTPSEEYEIHVEDANDGQTYENHESFVVFQKAGTRTSSADKKVELMLNLYLKHKKTFQQDYWRRGLWETIAMEIGEEDGEYWQKRFLNYKQHYIRLLDKQRQSGPNGINWPYFALFDKIFEGDENFRKKYAAAATISTKTNETTTQVPMEWDNTEKTVLVKYCFDSFDEFQDHTIPDNFLWNEIGRLLDRSAESCKQKYEELKNAHLDGYIDEGYDIRSRKPIEILFDNIISKEIELLISSSDINKSEMLQWKIEEMDELAQFFYGNIELFKDPLCHYVCWAAITKKLKRDLDSCRGQWDDLVSLYKTILNDKKENPDMQIDWRYIELFDRIFDYGMDETLLTGLNRINMVNQKSGKVGVKKVKINLDDIPEEFTDDEDSFDEGGFTKGTKRHAGESKAFKILEFYQRNKDKFNTTKRNKHSLWEVLAKQIGISAIQCSHRLRNLRQVYTAYVQKEINKPEMPILWPYYALCKKVFGYRAIKNKLKNGKLDYEDNADWSAKEIKQLINYFSEHFHEISNNVDDIDKWADLGEQIGKSVGSCKDKFMELRKSYRKLRTMRSKNPDVKISWKYFNMFEQVYTEKEGQEAMVVEHLDQEAGEQEEDDYQCIIVMSEGEDMPNMENNQTHIEDSPAITRPLNKWSKRTKKRLLALYINHVRSHKGKEIVTKDMWSEIASKLQDKTPLSCRKMFAKMKANHRTMDEHDVNMKRTPYYGLLERISRLKPNFAKSGANKTLTDGRSYKDVAMSDEKVEQALTYYLQHIEDFMNPKFEKKFLWTELANYITEPVTKAFNKINYLKQYYNSDTDEVAGVKTQFAELLKEILAKEIAIKIVIDNQPKPVIDESITEELWTDEETEQLLEWYLSNLDKFKNPKFVRSYLWMEASSILNKSAIVCSKKMYEIRTEYRHMVREKPDELSAWRFHNLCQKIYGTGKKGNSSMAN